MNKFLARLTAAAAVLTAPDATLQLQTTLTPASAPDSPDMIEIKVNGLDQAKQSAMWLTKGQTRTLPTTAVRLLDCTTDHLQNIVANKPNLSADYRRVIESILEDRGVSIDAVAVDHDDVTDAVDDDDPRFSHLS